ncbi:hypothetical protein NGC81_01780 [Staphylococcus xylosus]|uniref:hypothetical protein n=1 Tax=Staphylococcus xylosus TaxID=1288 RepID=UPI002DB7B748|nr:hypothetical protein [Staphylococcus xylosus]MEB7755332.1 hypothetical protein [Staphylococcus xylosus]
MKFVRDTAVKRRNLTRNQILDIVLSASDLIEDIGERAKENQLSGLKQNKPLAPVDGNGEKPLTPTKQNREIAKLTDVSERTVDRAKRVKKEAPEKYKRPFYWTLTL